LFRIAVNLCRDHFRRKKVRRIVSHYEREDSQADESVLIDHSENPAQILDREEKRRYIESAVGRLAPALRTVFVLRDIQGLSYGEIADMMSWRLGTVKSRLFRARRELAGILSPYMEEL
jgi:RNA polymerase sigma-70 factor (ECF subfamily)